MNDDKKTKQENSEEVGDRHADARDDVNAGACDDANAGARPPAQAGDNASPAAGAMEATKNEAEELREKCDEYLAGWKRAQADYQNLVKEVAKDKMEFVKYANQALIMELLPILDNFKAAFNLIPEAESNSAWVVGFSHIKKQLFDFLTANGVEEIKTVGEKLDVSVHEAVEYDEKSDPSTSSGEEGEIIAERKSGYKLNGRVIQVAKVVVSGKKE